MKYPTRAEQFDWDLLQGRIDPILLDQLIRINNPNDSIHASDMINDVLNRIVTTTYGWEATFLTNRLHYGTTRKILENDGIMCNHRFFRVPEKWENTWTVTQLYQWRC